MTIDEPGAQPARDYAQINTLERAQLLVREGDLVPLLLLPELFGGESRPENVVYVPPFVARLKSKVEHEIILPLLEDGQAVEYRVMPQYAGRSLVPTTLTIMAPEPAGIAQVILIWEASSHTR